MNDIFSDSNQTQIESDEKISKIDLDESVELYWMKNIVISQSDRDPVEVGQNLEIRAHIVTKEVPKESIIHIYHEDATNFFENNNEDNFYKITDEMGRIPAISVENIFHLKFNLEGDDVKGTKEPFTLNVFKSHTFQKSGVNFAIVSMEIQNGGIVHYSLSSNVTNANEIGENWVNRTLGNLLDESVGQKAMTFLTLGFTVLGTGLLLFFIGINFWMDSSKDEKIKIRRLDTINFGAIGILPAIILSIIYVISNSNEITVLVLAGFLYILGIFITLISFPKESKSS